MLTLLRTTIPPIKPTFNIITLILADSVIDHVLSTSRMAITSLVLTVDGVAIPSAFYIDLAHVTKSSGTFAVLVVSFAVQVVAFQVAL